MKLNNGYTQDGRYSIDIGFFGAVRKWNCCCCGPIDRDPEWHVTERQSYWSPEEGVLCCPECGDHDCMSDDPPRWTFKPINRRTITLHHNPATSAVAP